MSIPSIQSTNRTTQEVSTPASPTQEMLQRVASVVLQAIQNIQNSTTDQPHVTDLDMLSSSARCLAKIGQFAQTLNVEPNNMVALEGLGDICCLEANPSIAKKYYEKVMSIDPYNGTVMAKLGDVYAMLRDTRMLELLAKTYVEQGDNEGAKIQYKRIFNIDPNNIDALNNFGLLLSNLEDYSSAQLYYERAAAIEPNSPEILTNLGIAVLRQGNLEQSKTYLIQALNINPNFWQASYHLGQIYYQQGELENAKKAFLQSLQHAPDKKTIDILNLLGATCMLQRNHDQGKQYFEQVLNIDPNHLLARQNLGEVFRIQRNFVQAEMHLRNALTLDRYDWFTLSRLGAVLYRQDKLEEAKYFLEEAASLTPSSFSHQILHCLGNVLLSMSNLAQDEDTKRKYRIYATDRFNQAQYADYEYRSRQD